MKTRVIPCICTDHEPNAGDSILYGMPQLQTTPDMRFFVIFCPRCKMGGMHQYKSAYLAVKHWNLMQRKAREELELVPCED